MQQHEKIPLLAVVGPTASGKSRLAVELALRYDGEVVSADSMQVYRGMPVATAQPTAQECRGVPHHLIGFLDPGADFSVASYVQLASRAIAGVHSRGKLPILAGGTGLYISSLLDGVSFAPMGQDPGYRRRLQALAAQQGPQAVHALLARQDPQTAARLHPANVGRVIRALEVQHLTGQPMSQHLAQSRREPSPYRPLVLGLTAENRQFLYDRIDRRVDQMVQGGLLEEARAHWQAQAGRTTAGQAIGYKELAGYLAGEQPLEQALENLKRQTRRYAKRQLTWFRRDVRVHWLAIDQPGGFEAVCVQAFSLVDGFMQSLWKEAEG